ncbi:MAG: hypothetical protein HFP81_05050 [Methylococcales symbiont of Hymedesmia sp. n. MRB-2018]|nr:MAG: hypothetical protein HFP78_04200 [Methylococcales symbiont of Hymedesmia sp. n. MRB-2018]KAF3983898.1 MAG: hypothetical protein HFP81_05050 [Methylococcales symbiont of Hymedesmia sp. n. MRB-2018]
MNKIILMLSLAFVLFGCIKGEGLQEIRERGRAEIQKEELKRGYADINSTYLTLDKGEATRCEVLVKKSSRGNYFDKDGQRAYDISHNLRSRGVRRLNLSLPQTSTDGAVEISFPERNSFINIFIRDHHGNVIKKDKVFFKVNSRHTYVNLKMPRSCYPRSEKPSKHRYKKYYRD